MALSSVGPIIPLLIPSAQLTTLSAAVYTGPADGVVITSFTFANTSGSNVTVTLNRVAVSGSASDSNILAVKTHQILANGTYILQGEWGLLEGQKIYANASANSSVTLQIDGYPYTEA